MGLLVSSSAFPTIILLLTCLAAVPVSSFQFNVGAKTGWTKPTGKESETYNEWAIQNRFQIGDTLYFKYEDESVLEVGVADYRSCNVSNPIAKFDDGDSVFQFRRSGLFYFISGREGHCKAGQKLIVRVMHLSGSEAASSAASPTAGDGNLGPPQHSSTSNLFVDSHFITAVGGFLVFLYLLM